MNFVTRIFVKLGIVKKDLDYHFVRASMVIIFLFFGYQKWFDYEAQALIPYISNPSAGGFPAVTETTAFLMKDLVLLACIPVSAAARCCQSVTVRERVFSSSRRTAAANLIAASELPRVLQACLPVECVIVLYMPSF